MIANPDIALLLVIAGLLGIYAELLRPGMIAPGVAGASLVAIAIPGVHRAGLNPTVAVTLVAPFALITVYLLSIAVRARRGKLDVKRPDVSNNA